MQILDQEQEQIIGPCKIIVAGARISYSVETLTNLGELNSTLQLFL